MKIQNPNYYILRETLVVDPSMVDEPGSNYLLGIFVSDALDAMLRLWMEEVERRNPGEMHFRFKRDSKVYAYERLLSDEDVNSNAYGNYT